ncbi:IS982 family transposase [Candidatus Albibeggiatoa sp. nov. NOAA]|uniref:IS982 family transposase n=1 Tax=Candidatus Albibeggiatoa sp. nov. NOAA TaxID=3162724 RepID=UPI0032F96B99|nr:IS982 family transposase [Thiotrichaceae bacterium]
MRVYLIDGFPLPVSHFKRAASCKLFQGLASYGYCASKSEYYFGCKGHLLLDARGIIVGFSLTPAHESEHETVWELLEGIQGALLLGDKGYLGHSFKQQLFSLQGIELQTPVRHNMKDVLPKDLTKQG